MIAIVGAGAAGLATAIFTARRQPAEPVVTLDGARILGAKILVSGGGRCNVTNVAVGPADFWGGNQNIVKQVLRAFTAEQGAAFFRELGVALHVEEDGKLFPDTHRARTVLDGLLAEARRLGVSIHAGCRVKGVRRAGDGFVLETSRGPIDARRLVLATGGLSLPKTGSDGGGYRLAEALGHGLVPQTPALAPLLLSGSFHRALSGVAHEAELTVRAEGTSTRLRGALLWTHFGISGPVALNASRHWHQARREGRAVTVEVNLLPGEDFATAEAWLLAQVACRPRALVATALAARLPTAVVAAVLDHTGVERTTPLSRLTREARRTLVRRLVELEVAVRDSRGYAFAEVTAGGVPLDEVDSKTMQSRKCPGLFLVGEILDVDGRIGGFNFQWAWSSAWVAARGLVPDRTPAPSVAAREQGRGE